MATKVYFQHPETEKIKIVKIGFHWLGGTIPLLNGTGTFGIFLFAYIWPWGLYRKIIKILMENGYKYKSHSDGKPIDLIESKLGFSISN